MKTIMNILLCLAIAASMVSCGMSGNKKEEGKLSRKEKKEVKKILDDRSDKVEIKGDKVIRTTKGLGATSVTVYHFEKDKLTSISLQTEVANNSRALELRDFYKENRPENFTDISVKDRTVTCLYGPTMVQLYSSLTKKSLRDKLQKEIDESKEFMESIKDKL